MAIITKGGQTDEALTLVEYPQVRLKLTSSVADSESSSFSLRVSHVLFGLRYGILLQRSYFHSDCILLYREFVLRASIVK